MKHFALKLITVAGFGLVLAGCGDDKTTDIAIATGEGSPLAHVPADTPYVFANLEAWPQDVVEKWAELFAPVQAGYRESLALMRTELAKIGKEQGDPEKTRKALAVMELFEDKLSLEGWESMGFSRRGRLAFYGVGLIPVLRMEVAEPDKLRAFIARVEAATETTFPVAELDGTSYWRFAPQDDQPFALVMAIIGQQLIVTMDPGPEIAPLASVMGLVPPATSLVDSGELAAINRANGYGPYGTFLVDSGRLAAAVIGVEGQDTFLTEKMAAEGKPMTPECRSELMAMAGIMPRMVSGYTAFDTRNVDSGAIIELRTDLATGLMPIAAPVPGLGGGGGALPFDAGFGIKLDKLAEFLQARAATITAEPYTCEYLAGINEGASQMGTQAAGLYMAAGWFTGMRMVLTQLEWTEGAEKPERIEGALVIASPNPVGLVGMLKGFVPQLSALNITPGGEPQALALGEMAGEAGQDLPPTFVAMSDSAIGLSVGESSASGLAARLAESPAAPPPLIHFAYQGELYSRLMKRIQAYQSAQVAAVADTIEEATGEDQAAIEAARMQRVMEPFLTSFNGLYAAIEHADASLLATERGLEFKQSMRMR